MERGPDTDAKKVVDGFTLQEGRFPEVLSYDGYMYDLRELMENGDGWYRLTNEARIEIEAPSYIQVDRSGTVIQERN